MNRRWNTRIHWIKLNMIIRLNIWDISNNNLFLFLWRFRGISFFLLSWLGLIFGRFTQIFLLWMLLIMILFRFLWSILRNQKRKPTLSFRFSLLFILYNLIKCRLRRFIWITATRRIRSIVTHIFYVYLSFTVRAGITVTVTATTATFMFFMLFLIIFLKSLLFFIF